MDGGPPADDWLHDSVEFKRFSVTIEQSGIVDIIAVKGEVAELIISDHLEWGVDDGVHMLRIQEKVNEYLAAIECGTLLRARPDLSGKRYVVEVSALHKPSSEASVFYHRLQVAMAAAGYAFRLVIREGLIED